MLQSILKDFTGVVFGTSVDKAAHVVPREGPYLRPEVQELRDLHILLKPVDNGGNAAQADSPDTVKAPEAPAKRTTGAKSRPKWMRM